MNNKIEFETKTLQSVLQLRKLKVGNFPQEVRIENTNLCNAACIICPREKMTRPSGIMSINLFEKIIKEIAQHPIQSVHLQGYGEPLIDKEFPLRIQIAKKLKISCVLFWTNASLLTPELTQSILSAGIDKIIISFYGTRQNTYEKTMRGLDYHSTLNNIFNLFWFRKQIGMHKPSITLRYIPILEKQDSVKKFYHQFSSLITPALGDSFNFGRLHNYGGGRDYISLKKIYSTCERPWWTLMILQDGRVSTCCKDFNGEQIIGNLHDDTIENIWKGERMNQIRHDFMAIQYQTYPVCLQCEEIY